MAAATQFRTSTTDDIVAISPALRRALRDSVASEVLAIYLAARVNRHVHSQLIGETIEYSSSWAECARLNRTNRTVGVIVADVLRTGRG